MTSKKKKKKKPIKFMSHVGFCNPDRFNRAT